MLSLVEHVQCTSAITVLRKTLAKRGNVTRLK